MALVLQERGIGRRSFREWVSAVPGFDEMPAEKVEELVDNLLRNGVLWEENGILSFGPSGEAE